MQGVFVAVHEGIDGGVALGDPGALVEEVGGGVEIGERQLDQAAAETRQQGESLVEAGCHRRVAEELAIGSCRHADRE